jgi:hypothetical protein
MKERKISCHYRESNAGPSAGPHFYTQDVKSEGRGGRDMTTFLVTNLAQEEKILTFIGRYLVRISVGTSLVLLEEFIRFSLSLQTNTLEWAITSPSTSLAIYELINLRFDDSLATDSVIN